MPHGRGGTREVWAGHLLFEMLTRRENSSGSASITRGDTWLFQGDWTGEAQGIIGEASEVEGDGSGLSTFSFGRFKLRRRTVKYRCVGLHDLARLLRGHTHRLAILQVH